MARGGDLRKGLRMARSPNAPSIPTNGKDTWRTPPEELFLIHRIYGGPDVAREAPVWQPGWWKHPGWHDQYIGMLAWLRDQGTIDLDPCADIDEVYHYATENTSSIGLDPNFPWFGRTFANVPYSATKKWVAHGADQTRILRETRTWRGRATLFLIPAAPTNNYWIDNMLLPGALEHPFGPGVNLFATTRGRIGFIGPDGPVKNNLMGSALVGWVDPAMGDHAEAELERAGWVVHRRPKPMPRLGVDDGVVVLFTDGETLAVRQPVARRRRGATP